MSSGVTFSEVICFHSQSVAPLRLSARCARNCAKSTEPSARKVKGSEINQHHR
jgi:hypothetical protein